jgi:hypothetical protein
MRKFSCFFIGLFLLTLSFNAQSGPFDELKKGLEDLNTVQESVVSEIELTLPEYSPLGKRIANGEAVYSDTFYWINADGTIASTNRGWSRNEAEKELADASISPEERKAQEEERERIAAEKKAREEEAAAKRRAAQAEENKKKKNYTAVENNAATIVAAAKCMENYWLSAQDEKLLKDHAQKEIKDYIAKGLVPKEYANKQIKNYRVMLANFGYEQMEMCELFKVTAQMLRSQTEEDLF